MPIAPTKDQIQALVESDLDTPVVMLNLLKFAERSGSENGNEGASGRDSYAATAIACARRSRRSGAGSLGRGAATRS